MSPALRSAVLGAVALPLLFALVAPAEAVPGVRFKRYNEYYEGEGVGTVTLIVEVTEPPTTPASISWETRYAFAATPGVDYVEASGDLSWAIGDDSDREIVVTVLQDQDEEPQESLEVALIPETAIALEPRFPESGYVFIIDDDGPAYFVVDGIVERNWLGQLNLVGGDGGSVDLTIRLAAPPTVPVTIEYQASPDPTIHSVIFDGVQERTVSIDAPEIPPGEIVANREVVILGSPARDGSFLWLNYFEEMKPGECFGCYVALVGAFMHISTCPDLCPLCPPAGRGPRSSDAWYPTLTRYRDEILSTTPDGLYYTQLFETLSPSMGNAVLRHPWFLYEVFRARAEWIDAIQAVVDGAGDSVVITSSMQDRLNVVLDRFIELGSPELVQAVQTETTRLDLRNLTGRTMDELQSALESSGVPVEPISWGRLKAGFR